MDKKLAEKLVYIIKESDSIYNSDERENTRVYEEYDGRAMYGNVTTAIVVPRYSMIIETLINCSDEFIDEEGYPLFDVQNISIDSLGHSHIVY